MPKIVGLVKKKTENLQNKLLLKIISMNLE